MNRSITRRLLTSSLVILAAFLGLAGTALDRAFGTSVESAAREQLQAHIYTLLTAAQADTAGRMRLPRTLGAPAFNRPAIVGVPVRCWGATTTWPVPAQRGKHISASDRI